MKKFLEVIKLITTKLRYVIAETLALSVDEVYLSSKMKDLTSDTTDLNLVRMAVGVAFLPLLKILANPKVKVGIVEVGGGVKLSLYLENITKQEILDMIEELRK